MTIPIDHSHPSFPQEPSIANIHKRFMDLAKKLPEKLPFPFSGIVLFEVGNGPAIQASHFPGQENFSPSTPMNILSVGKLFTAVALMQLMGERLETPVKELLTFEELDLPLQPPYDDEEKQYALKQVRTHYDQITIEHLLSHTAGLGKSRQGQETKIGEYGYSNYGFQLLARIIGKLSAKNPDHPEASFHKYIKENIFNPSGMQGEMHPPNVPQRFDLGEKGPQPIPDDIPDPYPHGNGCWKMTAQDLMLFGNALRSHTFISEQAFHKMLQHEPPLGFKVDHDEDGRMIGYGHPGGGPGQSAFFYTWLTHPPITAVVLSNYPTGADVKPWLDTQITTLIR